MKAVLEVPYAEKKRKPGERQSVSSKLFDRIAVNKRTGESHMMRRREKDTICYAFKNNKQNDLFETKCIPDVKDYSLCPVCSKAAKHYE